MPVKSLLVVFSPSKIMMRSREAGAAWSLGHRTMTDIPKLQSKELTPGEIVNIPNKPSDYVIRISICNHTVPQGVYIHCRVCASAISLCCKGSEPEGGGAIIRRC